MKQSEIEDKIIEEISDWNIIRDIINRYDQEEIARRQQTQQRIIAEEEAQKKREARRYNTPTYYQESAMERGHRMRRHNDIVASQGYGSSYF